MNNQDTRFANQYAIQWFPGHMAKTLRMMEQEIQHVDASLVLLDARIPLSSLNPEIERITARKPKLYALNKADLADPAVTEEWIRYFHDAHRWIERKEYGRLQGRLLHGDHSGGKQQGLAGDRRRSESGRALCAGRHL